MAAPSKATNVVAFRKPRRSEPETGSTWWRQAGRRVALLRKTRGIALEHLAQVTDTRFEVLQDLEAGEDRLMPTRLFRIAECLGVRYADITPPFCGPVPQPGEPEDAHDVPMKFEPLDETMDPWHIPKGLQDFLDRHAEAQGITPLERWHLANVRGYAPEVRWDDSFWLGALKFNRKRIAEEREEKNRSRSEEPEEPTG